MKAGFFRKIIIILQSAIAVIAASIETIAQKKDRCTRQCFDKIFRTMCQKLLRAARVSYTIHHRDKLTLEPHQHYIVMCNHSSLYDIPLSTVAVPGSLRMMAKRELFKVPLWGRAMKKSGFIPIDRNNRAQAKKDLDYAKEKMKSGIMIWIAPEGTRSKTGKLQSFKKGGFMLAYQTDAIIIPIGIRGAQQILPAKTLDFNLNQHVDIYIGQPIDTKDYKIREREKLMDDVKHSIAELAGLDKD